MSDDVVSRAKAALEGVDGPWEAERELHSLDDGVTETCWDVDGPGGGWVARCQDFRTAYFVAAARSLVPELVAEIERLRRQHQVQSEHIVALRTELDRLGGES